MSSKTSSSSLILGQKSKFKVDFVPREKWVPDSKVKNCPVCLKPFGLFNGRHHCRICGNIFDGRCSNNFLTPPVYIYNDEKKIRVCDNCFNTLKKKEVDHSFYNHSLAKYTDAVEKGLSKMLNDAPYIPIVVPEEQQQKKYTASVTPIPEKPDNDEESKIEIRSESVYDNRRDRKNLSVTSEYLSKITPSDKRILLIFDKELIFAQDPIIYSIENDIKHDTTILPLSECEDLTFDDRYRLVLVFINHWRHVTEETEKLCQKIYNIYPNILKMIYLTCEINKQVYKKAELPLKSENVLKMTYGKDKKINPKTHRTEFVNFVSRQLLDQ